MKPIIISVPKIFFVTLVLLMGYVCFMVSFCILHGASLSSFLGIIGASVLIFLNLRHILFNWVSVGCGKLFWSYSPHCYRFMDLLFLPPIKHYRFICDLKAVSLSSFRYLPMEVRLISLGSFIYQISHCILNAKKKDLFRNRSFATFYSEEESFVFYTGVYNKNDLIRLYHFLNKLGVKVLS